MMENNEKTEQDKAIEKDNAFFLSMQFGVMRQILNHLPARDLGKAALVCQVWNDVCRIIRQERQAPHWFECHVAKGGPRGRGTAHARRAMLNKEFGEVYCEPELCIFFISTRFLSMTYEDRENASNSSRNVDDVVNPVIRHFLSMLPMKCVAFGMETFGVIGTPWNLGPTLELETAALSALLIPKINGVKVRHFCVDSASMDLSQIIARKKILSDEELEELTGIPPGEEVKCLLLLSSYSSEEEITELIIRTLLERMNNKIAIGGGYGENYICSPPVRDAKLLGVAISGNNVRAVSTIIQRSVTKIASIDKVIAKLSACRMPTENCVGFMFACMGRCSIKGRNGAGLESSLFRNHFPSVPLTGFFGSGEIGIEYLSRCDSEQGHTSAGDVCEIRGPSAKKIKGGKIKLMHVYTTVIVMVSLGKGKLGQSVSNIDT